MNRPEHPAGDPVAVARRELQEIVAGLTGSEARLRAVHRTLEPPAAVPQDDEEGALGIRTIIECVLTDSLGPAIRDLQTATLEGSGEAG